MLRSGSASRCLGLNEQRNRSLFLFTLIPLSMSLFACRSIVCRCLAAILLGLCVRISLVAELNAVRIVGSHQKGPAALSASLINGKREIGALHESGVLRVYDAETLAFRYEFQSPKPEPILKAVFDSMTRRFAYGIEHKAYLFDAFSKELHFEATEDFYIDRDLSISKNGSRLLLYNLEKTRVKVYDTSSGMVLLDTPDTGAAFRECFLSDSGDQAIVFTDIFGLQSSPFGFRRTIVGYEAIRYELDGSGSSNAVRLDLDPNGIISPSSLLVSSSVKDRIAILVPRYLFRSPDDPYVEFIFRLFELDTGALEYSSNLFLGGETFELTRYMTQDGDRVIVGDSGTGDQIVLDLATLSEEVAFDTMPINVPFETPQLAIRGSIEYIDANTAISLGNDGIVVRWKLLEGAPVRFNLKYEEGELACRIDSTAGLQYRLTRGSRIGELKLDETSIIANGDTTTIPVSIPVEDPVFFQAFEFPAGD